MWRCRSSVDFLQWPQFFGVSQMWVSTTGSCGEVDFVRGCCKAGSRSKRIMFQKRSQELATLNTRQAFGRVFQKQDCLSCCWEGKMHVLINKCHKSNHLREGGLYPSSSKGKQSLTQGKSLLYQNLLTAHLFSFVWEYRQLLQLCTSLFPVLTGSEKYLVATVTVEKWQPEVKISVWDGIETVRW